VSRKFILKVTPSFLTPFIGEILATLELCADCAELGVVWEIHGNIGYGLALLLCCLSFSYTWEDAEACPAGPLEDCFLLGSSIISWRIATRLLGQILGAYFTWRYVQFFWGLHLIPAHIALNTLPCQAGLQCTMIYGAIMEAFISFISRIVALETTSCVQSISAVANSVTTVALCIFALDSSGGFFNPILASALTLNCKGNNFVEHFFVYWAGSLVGGVVARTLHLIVHRKATLVAKEKDD